MLPTLPLHLLNQDQILRSEEFTPTSRRTHIKLGSHLRSTHHKGLSFSGNNNPYIYKSDEKSLDSRWDTEFPTLPSQFGSNEYQPRIIHMRNNTNMPKNFSIHENITITPRSTSITMRKQTDKLNSTKWNRKVNENHQEHRAIMRSDPRLLPTNNSLITTRAMYQTRWPVIQSSLVMNDHTNNNNENYDPHEDRVINLFERQNTFLSHIANNIAQQTRDRTIEENRKLEEKIRKLETIALFKEYDQKIQEIKKNQEDIELEVENKRKTRRRTRYKNFLNNYLERVVSEKLINSLSLENKRMITNTDSNNKRERLIQLDDDEDRDFYNTGLTRQTDYLDYTNSKNKLKPLECIDQNQIASFNPQNFYLPNNIITPYTTDNSNINPNRFFNTILNKSFHMNSQYKNHEYNNNHQQKSERNGIASRENIGSEILMSERNSKPKKKKDRSAYKQKQDAKLKARKNLRIILWTMIYGPLLAHNSLSKIKNNQKTTLSEINSYLGPTIDCLTMLFTTKMNGIFNELYKDTKPLCIINGLERGLWSAKIYTEKELDERSNAIHQKISKLMNSLINLTKSQNFQAYHLRLFCLIAKDGGILPKYFMFDFEIKRLFFSYYASLKNVNPSKTKMIVGMLIFFRIFIYKFILKPWLVYPNLNKNDAKFVLNQKMIGSILFHSMIDYYKYSIAIEPKNQEYIRPEMKIKPRVPFTLYGEDETADDNKSKMALGMNKDDKKRKDEDTILQGIFSREELKEFFVERKKKADDLKALIDCWHTILYDIIENYYKEEFCKKATKP